MLQVYISLKMDRETMICLLLLLCGSLFSVSHGSTVSYNRTYSGYKYILPLQSFTHKYRRMTLSPLKHNFADAQRWCSSQFNGSKFATIASSAIQKNINDFIRGAKKDMNISDLAYVRVGGKSDNEWRWVNGKIVGRDIRGGTSPSAPYAAFEAGVNKFARDDSTAKKCYICERSSYAVPDSRVNCHFNERGRCYIVTNTSANWTEARRDCVMKGGDLASFDIFNDTTSFEAFAQTLPLVSKWQYWVGLQKNWFWRWNNREYEMNYKNWQPGEPSTETTLHCVVLHFPNIANEENGKWKTSNCFDPLPFICEIPNIDEATTVVTTESSTAFETTVEATSTTNCWQDQQLIIMVLSASLATCVIVAIVLAIALIITVKKLRTRNNDGRSAKAPKDPPKSKQPAKSSNNQDKAMLANGPMAENTVDRNLALYATTGPPPNTTHFCGNSQLQQPTIYASVESRGWNSASPGKRDEIGSAAAADAGKLLYAEVEFVRP